MCQLFKKAVIKYCPIFLFYFFGFLTVYFAIKIFPPKVVAAPIFDPMQRDVTLLSDKTFWKYQCIDTMKYSRDTARAWEGKESDLQKEINFQIAEIKKTGANCVAIATPYDEEFVQFLTRWVLAARRAKLHVWFRGNFSGWEEWFGYHKIKDPAVHVQKTFDFIVARPELFEEGDIFTPAPEAENGGPGDPRQSSEKMTIFNNFLVASHATCVRAFSQLNIRVWCGAFSSNYDVESQSLWQTTVRQLGSVAIDHYVSSPQKFEADIVRLFDKFKEPIFIGEFGAPIPDINGQMSEGEQANFVDELMFVLLKNRRNIDGLNYWTLKGGSTTILNDDGTERQAFAVLQKYFSPGFARGKTKANQEIKTADGSFFTTANENGNFVLAVPAGVYKIPGFKKFNVKTGEITLLN